MLQTRLVLDLKACKLFYEPLEQLARGSAPSTVETASDYITIELPLIIGTVELPLITVTGELLLITHF